MEAIEENRPEENLGFQTAHSSWVSARRSHELEFRRVAASIPGFEIHFVDKKANLAGLQIADLVARPIGRHVLNPDQPNRAFDIISPKLRRGPDGQLLGYGLKIHP